MAKTMNHQAFEGCFQEFNRFKRTQVLSEYNIIEDIAFDQARKCLYEKNLLGISNAEALPNTVWLFNSVHFGLRGCEEHRQLTWGDVQLYMKADGY